MQNGCRSSKNNDKLMLAVKCCLQVLSEIFEMSPGSTAISAFTLMHVLATPNYPVQIFGLVQSRYSEAETRKDDNYIIMHAGLEHRCRA